MDVAAALGGTELRRRAALLLQQAEREPGQVRADGPELLGAAVAADDPAATSVVERALGISDRELHDLRGALRHLSRAVRCAERAGLGTLAAQARPSPRRRRQGRR
jgi:hypothetical protein